MKEKDNPQAEHILACLSSAPSNKKIIRTAGKMAKAFQCQFTALYVENGTSRNASAENKQRLQEHRMLAEQLGADIETVFGDDVAFQIAEFARLSGVTQIVIGRSAAARKHWIRKKPLTEQLLAYASETDIHIIPDFGAEQTYRTEKNEKISGNSVKINLFRSACILTGATLLSMLFNRLGFTDANLIMVYILGVLLTSISTSHLAYSLVSAAASVLIFNYLFTIPRFTFRAYGTGYPMTFVIMFLTAFVTGTFANRYKAQAGESARVAHRNRILLDTDRMLSKAKERDAILQVSAEQIGKLLSRNIVMYEACEGMLKNPRYYKNTSHEEPYDTETEKKTAEWVLRNNHMAGAATDLMSEARYLYLALRVNDRVYAVAGIQIGDEPLEISEHGILLTILGECALALENEKNAREKEATAIFAKSEQLRANLLRTISHDLRTPLISISGHASNLLKNAGSFDTETKMQIYSDIYEDSVWLISLVENLLYATRIEEGRMSLTTSVELLEEIMEAAVERCRRNADGHRIEASFGQEMILVRADAKLIIQVIVNLIDNAVKYTPKGTSILIEAKRKGKYAEITVADQGNGIADKDKGQIFEKFYCGANKSGDSRRSLGLGLYLCRTIIEAHGGEIFVEDNHPHGAVFRFSIPGEEIEIHEQMSDSGSRR